MDLTKDADKILCCIYRRYLERRKAGEPKRNSKRFHADFYLSDKKLSSWHDKDISDTLLELARKKYIRIYLGGDFDLEDESIIYMEGRFKKGLTEITDFISKLIP